MKRVPELDSLRGLAAVAVVVHHFYTRYMPFGWAAVDLFFVMSGYLITRIIIAEVDSDRFLLKFAARRSLRIWPIYYLTLFVIVAANPFLTNPYPLNGLPYYLTYTQNLPHYWGGQVPPFNRYFGHTITLAVEEQFYLIWPLLVWFLGRRWIIPMTIGFAALAVAARAGGYSETLLMARCDGLALGGLLGALHSDPVWMRRHGSRLSMALLVGFVSLAALLLGLRLGFGGTSGLGAWPWLRSLSLFAINLFFVALVGVVVDRSGRPCLSLLRDARLCYLGTISYGLYLYHTVVWIFVLELASRWGLGEPRWLGLVAMAVAVGLAVVSWECLERPILRLKDRFRYRAATPAPSTAPAAVAPGVPTRGVRVGTGSARS